MNSRIPGLVEAVLIAIIAIVLPGYAILKPHGVPNLTTAANAATGPVDGARIANQADGEWLSNGRTYFEQRYSPLKQIDLSNVKNLGEAWEFRTGTIRGLESTPLVADGVMYVTGSWSKVWALDAKTGKQIWAYDPHVPGQWARYACCDVVNRGVALWKGAAYVGTLDGRLVKLDAKTGAVLWDVNTIDRSRPYTITGAPRVVKGKVLIGNGGAEYGVRGYLSAYDADTGKIAWRFFVVPGDPSKPAENPAMEAALKTWSTGGTDKKWWMQGGGGTPWDSMAYDPDLDLIYLGTGNGASWNRNLRSPGGGDNLYLSSILAIKPDTGELVWHYQTTPGDDWDYTATQHIILADITIDGAKRKVLMQAPKNGFFYVLDRETGKLISAKPYTTITWATGVDMATGRPIENPSARYTEGKPSPQIPGPIGAHNWQPMSFDPDTGLVYIPVIDGNFVYAQQPKMAYQPGAWNVSDFAQLGHIIVGAIQKGQMPAPAKGFIRAWDPVAQRMVWQVAMTGAWNSGMLTTAGGLLFAGGSDGVFAAYDTKTGAKTWSLDLKTGINAPAITYTIDGEQYVAVAAAFGGSGGLGATGDMKTPVQKYGNNEGRIFAFKLGGKQEVAALPSELPTSIPAPPNEKVDAAMAAKGFDLFHRHCAVCHGVLLASSGEVPDLRSVSPEIWNQYDAIVLDGALADAGMASFKDILSKDDVADIRAYVLDQSHLAWDQAHPKK
jgi:PQQ-dependent dehydrogenase (methanol/ethanol family)